MAKKKKNQNNDEQLDLIDVHPENEKEIIRIARAYKKAQKERLEALAAEIEMKEKLLEAVRNSGVQSNPDGTYAFTVGKVKISVTPRDELIRVKIKDESSEDQD